MNTGIRTARVKMPLTCGELFQGTVNGIPGLVSCPIDSYHQARVRVDDLPGWSYPPNCGKTRRAFQLGLSALDFRQGGGALKITSNAPRERGYGTSTADIGASLFALGEALGTPFAPAEAARIAVRIEPSDSTFFPGLTWFDHLQGRFARFLGEITPIPILVIDPGGRVSTLAFNRRDHHQALRKCRPHHEDAFEMLKSGIENQDWEMIGSAASLSAVLHEEILPNPILKKSISLAGHVHAYGVCRAHSGTLVGVLLNPHIIETNRAEAFFRKFLPAGVTIYSHQLINGGAQLLPAENSTELSRRPHEDH